MMLDAAAVVLSAAGLCAPPIAATAGSYRAGIAMMLELWMAAGLLRLAHAPSWPTLVTAAVLVSLRKLLLLVLYRECRS
jgi:Protein of unknown function (DUF1622)